MLEINGNRLWETLEVSSQIGVGRPGGLQRVTLSDDDKVMRDLFRQWAQEAGCTVEVDQVGNMFCRRPGASNGPPVAMGSHLDTQLNGGRFDGILGVLAALECIRTLNDANIVTKRPLEIINWTNEEGARFAPPMLASSAFAGVYSPQWVYDRVDDSGLRFGDELKRIGYLGDLPVGNRPLDSYFELHIEQGPELDARKIPVGIVTHGYTTHGFIVDVKGETAHSGPCPMDK